MNRATGDNKKANMEKERLKFTTSIEEGVNKSEIIFISVGTPSLPNGQADLSFVEQSEQLI